MKNIFNQRSCKDWWYRSLLVAGFAFAFVSSLCGESMPHVLGHSVPWEFASARYEVTVNGNPMPVFFACGNLHFVSFDFEGAVEVKIRINENDYTRMDGVVLPKAADFWQESAIVRPLSRGVNPVTKGRDVTFTLTRPGQYAVERPGTSHKDEVLFLFANPPEKDVPQKSDPNVIWLEPGTHQRSVDLTSGQTLYLEAGAVLFGAVNVWDAEDVRVCGRGTVVFDGPTSRNIDSGWVHKKNWHPMTTHAVNGLHVEGVTFVARSRGWTIQTWRTWDATFENIKILNLTPEDMYGDGIDFYDGGRAKIRDSFFRTGDDCFAFYAAAASGAMRSDRGGGGHLPGAPEPLTLVTGEVRDIEIERCVLWPSIANVIRAGWINQAMTTTNITLRDCDVIHMARHQWMGAADGLFSTLSLDGKEESTHSDYTFEDIRIEDGGSLLGVYWPAARLKNFKFKNIDFLDSPGKGLVRADADGLIFENVRIKGRVATKAEELNLTFEGDVQGLRLSEVLK
jgi:hypothetical protein